MRLIEQRYEAVKEKMREILQDCTECVVIYELVLLLIVISLLLPTVLMNGGKWKALFLERHFCWKVAQQITLQRG